MEEVTIKGGELPVFNSYVASFTDQGIPYQLALAFGELKASLEAAQVAWISELKPWVDKHSNGTRSIGPGHPNHLAFLEDSAEVWDKEVVVKLQPVLRTLIDAGAEIMQRRADRGIGEPLILVFSHLEAMQDAGLVIDDREVVTA